MKINDYILKEIKALNTESTLKSAQKLFKNYPITHFPVVENKKLLGCFAEEDLQTLEKKEDQLALYTHLMYPFFAEEKSTVLELLKIFADNDTTIIPVLNKNKNYVGYYDLRDVLDVFSSSPFMTEESETLIVEKLETEYSIGEISQIAEANGGKLLGIYLSKKTNNAVQVTLKIVSQEINEIIQTFRRYDYKIVSKNENDVYLEDLKNRSDYLQKYLNI